ncbi:sigma factor-like helix-turn-helix DNA-binding protein, partial [Burkholderia cenocepacia]|nr:sigma factor-like helix-turn-helix DNA-binding protein [Burkholderia cenocepacia]
ALAALPPRQREALVLQYYQDMSNVEAANLMGITVDALESLLARTRRRWYEIVRVSSLVLARWVAGQL